MLQAARELRSRYSSLKITADLEKVTQLEWSIHPPPSLSLNTLFHDSLSTQAPRTCSHEPKIVHASALTSRTHSLEGLPTLLTYLSVTGTPVLSAKQALFKGCLLEVSSTFPNCCRRLCRKTVMAAQHEVFLRTVSFDTREM